MLDMAHTQMADRQQGYMHKTLHYLSGNEIGTLLASVSALLARHLGLLPILQVASSLVSSFAFVSYLASSRAFSFLFPLTRTFTAACVMTLAHVPAHMRARARARAHTRNTHLHIHTLTRTPGTGGICRGTKRGEGQGRRGASSSHLLDQ